MFSVLAQFLRYLVIMGGAVAALFALSIGHWWGWFMLAMLCASVVAGLVQGLRSAKRHD
ncbi:MAG: hypothetical protein IOMNBAOH_01091 [Rhodocyclaceae bacterium]|nr:hypothetical protein [Rhodocyclaceae bacterium]MCG3186534.1 hypothetical protein [Rhodocyclaceae bacterium]